MSWIIIKYFITAAIVVLISKFAKRSDKLGGLIAALPIMTFLTLVWLYIEKQPDSKIIMYHTPFGMCCRHCRCFLYFHLYILKLDSGQL